MKTRYPKVTDWHGNEENYRYGRSYDSAKKILQRHSKSLCSGIPIRDGIPDVDLG